MDAVIEADRCDACGSRAYLWAEHDDWPTSLAYCRHHSTEYLPELQACGATLFDMRHLIEK